MQRLLAPALFMSLMVLSVATPLTTSAVSAAVPATPTFNKDVLPILQKNCQAVSSPGRDRTDVVPDLHGHASVCEGDREGRYRQDDAALVCGSDRRALRKRERC